MFLFFFMALIAAEKVRMGLDHKQEAQGIAHQEDDGDTDVQVAAVGIERHFEAGG